MLFGPSRSGAYLAGRVRGTVVDGPWRIYTVVAGEYLPEPWVWTVRLPLP